MNTPQRKIVVIGAGPAGMMAGLRAAQLGAQVVLVEKKSHPGQKLLLSGKGRCNLTNMCPLEDFLKRFSSNGAFLRDAFKKFFNSQLLDFFEKRGLRLKVERQMRVFPVTDKASSILCVLTSELKKRNVKLICKTELKDIFIRDKHVLGVLLTGNKIFNLDRLILATGGVSYPFTGSNGDGIRIAGKIGHRIIEFRAGLVPLETRQAYPKRIQGLVLKNIRIKLKSEGREALSDIGELLFTDSGISGPLVLSSSALVSEWLSKGRQVSVEIDLKPAISEEQLKARLIREFSLNAKKSIKNTLKSLLPSSLIDIFLELAAISPGKKSNQVSQRERSALLGLLKRWRLDIIRTRPIEEAMVTRGGISLKDIDPRTMESRLIQGLYFAGEMIDVDADTGGFNLQAAFSTGYLAGESAALN